MKQAASTAFLPFVIVQFQSFKSLLCYLSQWKSLLLPVWLQVFVNTTQFFSSTDKHFQSLCSLWIDNKVLFYPKIKYGIEPSLIKIKKCGFLYASKKVFGESQARFQSYDTTHKTVYVNTRRIRLCRDYRKTWFSNYSFFI